MTQDELVMLPTAYHHDHHQSSSRHRTHKAFADCIWQEFNITHVCECKRVTKQQKGVCPFTSIIKDQTAEARLCVLVRHKLWQLFFGKTLSTAEIVPAYLLWNRFTIFARNLSCQSSCFRWKLVGLFFCGFREKKFAEIRAGQEQAHFLVTRLRCARLCLNVRLLAGYGFPTFWWRVLFTDVLRSEIRNQSVQANCTWSSRYMSSAHRQKSNASS